MSRIEKASEFRRAAVLAAQGATDEQALSMPSLYPEWAPGVPVGGEGQVSILAYKGQLYRVQTPHTTQIGWEPENAASLFTPINVSNSGTIEDPIPAVRGMEYEEGKYYLDPEDGQTYLCTRSDTLQYLPHELVGHYFELAEGVQG